MRWLVANPWRESVPARKRFEADAAGNLFQFRCGKSAAISRADQSAHGWYRPQADRNFFFFENFQDTDVGDSHGQTRPQCDSNSGEPEQLQQQPSVATTLVQSLDGPNNPLKRLHRIPTSGRPEKLFLTA